MSSSEPTASGSGTSSADRAGLLFHWLMLLIALVVLLLAATLNVPDDGSQVALPGLGWTLPETCAVKRLTGLPCPGCGLTRCFVSLVHLDLRQAVRYNWAGLILFGMILFQVPYRILQIRRIRRGLPAWYLGKLGTVPVWILLVAVLGRWFAIAASGGF